MLKSKKLLFLVVTVLVLIGIMTINVYASSNLLDIGGLLNSNSTTGTNTITNVVGNEVTNATSNTIGGGQVVQPDTNDTNTEADANLPQTGVTEDITVMFFIVVCVILAIYAYKKIRDYKA